MAIYNIKHSKTKKVIDSILKMPPKPIIIERNKLEIAALRVKKVEQKFKILVVFTIFQSCIMAYLLLK